jgi:hypothetical protein
LLLLLLLRLFGRILKLGTQHHRPGTLEQQFRAQARGQLLLNGMFSSLQRGSMLRNHLILLLSHSLCMVHPR